MLVSRYVPNESLGGRDFDRGDLLPAFNEGTDANWLRAHRPFLRERKNGRTVPCINQATGRWTVEKGQRQPIVETVPIANLRDQGMFLPVWNATSLRKEDWIQIDRQVTMVSRERLRAWADAEAAVPYGGFDGMSKLTLEYELMSESGEAVVDFDAMTEGRQDSVLFKLRSLPLPITHSDFYFSERRLRVSRNSTPLDTTQAEQGSRRIAEMIEKTILGVTDGFSGVSYGAQTAGYAAHDTSTPDDGHGSALGASTIYGYTTFPHRLTKTNFTTPTSSNGPTTYAEVLTAINTLHNQNFFGPFVIYHSTDWSEFMDSPFSTAGGNHPGETLRTMLLKNENISDVRRVDWLKASTNPFTLLFVQLTSNVVQAVNGMGITTLQWPTIGGMRQNFKIMAIMVPLLKSDYKGQVGILHGTTS